MHIKLTPQRSDDTLSLARLGSALIINGQAFDFGPLPDGAVLPRDAVDCAYLASDVTRVGGILHLPATDKMSAGRVHQRPGA